jgi:hypothetical protein
MVDEGLIEGDGSEFVDDSTEGIEIEPSDEESDVAKLASMNDDFLALDDEAPYGGDPSDTFDIY